MITVRMTVMRVFSHSLESGTYIDGMDNNNELQHSFGGRRGGGSSFGNSRPFKRKAQLLPAEYILARTKRLRFDLVAIL